MYTYLKTIKILRRRTLTPQVRDHQSVVGRAFAPQEGVVHVWWWYALCTQPSNLCFWEKLKPPLRHGLYLPAEPRLHQKPVLANLWLPELLALQHSYMGLCSLTFFLYSTDREEPKKPPQNIFRYFFDERSRGQSVTVQNVYA
jgi:hypothetical protein